MQKKNMKYFFSQLYYIYRYLDSSSSVEAVNVFKYVITNSQFRHLFHSAPNVRSPLSVPLLILRLEFLR